MRLNEINEPIKKVVFTFGRLNPPHYGHGGLIKTLELVAKQQGAQWFLFVSSKNEPEKNPLTYEQKCHWIRILFPETEEHLIQDASIKTPLVAATWLYKQGFRSATFVAGEDDMESYSAMIKSGNEHGRKNPDAVKAGKGFYFESLEFAISARLASATNSRAAVTNNDPEAFARSILGPKITDARLLKAVAKQMFPMVRKGMQLESVNEDFDADTEERRAFMLRPENQKETPISSALKNYTPLGDVGKIGLAINKGDYKGAVLPAAQLATNFIPGKAAATAASTAIGIARGLTGESEELNKRTPSVRELAKKYATDPSEIYRRVNRGVKVEFEHTNDIEVATEIAMDHLSEKLDYYTRLSKIENESEKIANEHDDDDDDDDADDVGARIAQAMGGTAGAMVGSELGPFGIAAGAVTGAELGKRAYRTAKPIVKPYIKSTADAVSDYGNRAWSSTKKTLGLKEIEDDAVAIPGEPVSAAMARMNARPTDQEKADFLGSYMKSALGQGGFTDGKFAQHTDDLKKKVGENFADGKGPGRPGDSQRHGIPKKASIAQLEKASHADGRKGQLARWQLNMRRGKEKANEGLDEDYRDAARYAAQAHAGQQRSGGKPYISHPVRVANLVRKYKDSAKLDKLLSAAFLHDTIEDTDTTEEQLRKMFGDLVATLVTELTSDKEKIEKLGKAEYLTQKMINMSSWGLVIKLADRLDNVADIKTAKTPEWRHRYREETESILSKLEQSRKLSGTHQNIIAAIRGKLAEIDESPIREAEEENVKPLVYLDMDGVLADFFGEWARISGVNHYKDIDNVEAKLQLVRDHPTFWVDLPMLPHAKALIQTVVKNYGEYRICSKPLEGDTRSEAGKLQWIKTHLSDMPPADIILTADKARFAKNDGYPSILVDDYGVNINSWKAAGGIGIKYEDQSFDKAARVLQALARSGVSK